MAAAQSSDGYLSLLWSINRLGNRLGVHFTPTLFPKSKLKIQLEWVFGVGRF